MVDANPRVEAQSSTRYLCVGAEIDSDLAHQVIAAVLEERAQAIAPSFGMDLVPIVLHALNGRRRRTTRDGAIAAIAAVNLVVNLPGTIGTALTWLFTRFAYRRTRLRWPQWGRRNALAVGVVAWAVGSFVLGLALLVPAALLGAAAGLVGGRGAVTGFFWFTSVLVPLSLLAVWGVLYWERQAARSVLVDTLRRDTFDPASRSLRVGLSQQAQQRLQAISDLQRQQNLTVYSGFFPFLGAGDQLRTWSFGIDLSRPPARPAGDGHAALDQAPHSFTIGELQDHVAARLEALSSSETDATQRLKGLVVEDRLFVHGTDVWRDKRLLPDPRRPPVAWVPSSHLRWIGDDPSGVVRQFKCARVESWGSEVVLSVFLHFATDGRTLYVEQTACLLPPIKASYRVVDSLTRRQLADERNAVLSETFRDVPAALLRAPVELWRGWRSRQRERQQADRLAAAIAEQLPIDYGARVSVRELGSADACRFWFQELDATKHQKIIEVQALNAIVDFLESHHIDTAEFRGRQTSILNSNTVVVAGDASGSSFAVGFGATAAVTGTGTAPAGSTPPPKG